MPDILFILVLALLIFGPKKLPEIARQVAKFMAQFRQMSNDLKRQLESEMLKIEWEEKEKKAAAASLQLEASRQPASPEALPPAPLQS
jgi:sec-independent protein translocase protein TatB